MAKRITFSGTGDPVLPREVLEQIPLGQWCRAEWMSDGGTWTGSVYVAEKPRRSRFRRWRDAVRRGVRRD